MSELGYLPKRGIKTWIVAVLWPVLLFLTGILSGWGMTLSAAICRPMEHVVTKGIFVVVTILAGVLSFEYAQRLSSNRFVQIIYALLCLFAFFVACFVLKLN